MLNVQDIRNLFRAKNRNEVYRGDTIEIQNAVFRTTDRAIFGVPNEKYIRAEIAWYQSQSRQVADLFRLYGSEVKIWQDVSDDFGKINSNYGWCVYSKENGRQYDEVLMALQGNPLSRQAVMIYIRPDMHWTSKAWNRNDFMCTTHVQYFINEGNLDATVYMRSNDAIFGYPNDLAWQRHVLDELSDDLDVHPGEIIWNVGSLHIYERHYDMIGGLGG